MRLSPALSPPAPLAIAAAAAAAAATAATVETRNHYTATRRSRRKVRVVVDRSFAVASGENGGSSAHDGEEQAACIPDPAALARRGGVRHREGNHRLHLSGRHRESSNDETTVATATTTEARRASNKSYIN